MAGLSPLLAQHVKKLVVALSLVWCAVDVSDKVYACFGFDMAACQTFIQHFQGQYGQMLMCRIR